MKGYFDRLDYLKKEIDEAREALSRKEALEKTQIEQLEQELAKAEEALGSFCRLLEKYIDNERRKGS